VKFRFLSSPCGAGQDRGGGRRGGETKRDARKERERGTGRKEVEKKECKRERERMKRRKEGVKRGSRTGERRRGERRKDVRGDEKGVHCKETIQKIRNKYSQKRNCGASVHFPYSCVCETYSSDRSAFSAVGKYVDQSWEYYKSLSDTCMWKLELRPRNSFSGNT
jgi:hypothetical protein